MTGARETCSVFARGRPRIASTAAASCASVRHLDLARRALHRGSRRHGERGHPIDAGTALSTLAAMRWRVSAALASASTARGGRRTRGGSRRWRALRTLREVRTPRSLSRRSARFRTIGNDIATAVVAGPGAVGVGNVGEPSLGGGPAGPADERAGCHEHQRKLHRWGRHLVTMRLVT